VGAVGGESQGNELMTTIRAAAASAAHHPTSVEASGVSSAPRSLWRFRAWGLLSALLLWLAFPPVNAWPLAWIAPLGWLRLIRQHDWQVPRPYRQLYWIGFLHWLLMIQWVRLPHWSAFFGWLALAAYLAAYVPLFIGVTRILVHRWGLSSVLAAPVVWTGLELARGRLFTGFSLALLGHTQLPLEPLVQVADLAGAYGVSFVVMLIAACLERSLPWPAGAAARRSLWPLGVAAASLAGCWFYGLAQLRPLPAADPPRRLRAALIQGAFDTEFDGDYERAQLRSRRAFFDYVRLSQQAARQHPNRDVVIWPESMFTGTEPMITYEPPVQPIDGWEGSLEELQRRLDAHAQSVRDRFAWVAQQVDAPLLVGLGWDHYAQGHSQRFNSVVFTDRQGRIVGRYDKMHPVMFGEYIPLGTWFPWLYRLTPMGDGLTAGHTPQAFQVGDVRIAPTVCFENTVPHLMRRQVNQLIREGQSPDVLVTVTNDGWFWGSSLLDIHLACGVFRAIELRRPLLIAANTGFSAWIDPWGRIRAKGPRRAEGTLLADVEIQPRDSLYRVAGDVFAGVCLLITLVALLGQLVPARTQGAQLLKQEGEAESGGKLRLRR
jgi:apolipoprotein N-acyltransferase